MPFELAALRPRLPLITTSIMFVLFIVLLPRYTDAAKLWYVLLILSGFFYLLFNPRKIVDTSAAERVFLAAVVLNFLWITFCYYANDAPERGHSLLWGRHFYFTLLVPLFFLFRQIEIPERVLLLAIAASVLVAIADITIDLARGVDHRVQGMNPNAFGPIQVCFFWTLAFFALQRQDRGLKICAAVCAGLALLAVIASGSKTTWGSFLLISVFFIFYLLPLSLPRKLALALALALPVSGLYYVPFVKHRIDPGIRSIESYLTTEKHETLATLGTFGARMELWKEAWHVFLDKPVTGAGLGGVKPMVEANRERYGTSELVYHKYVHNQYLAALATRGVPGLILFLVILLTPVYIAMSRKGFDRANRVAALSIVVIGLVYGLGSMWESHFEGKSAIMFTSIMLPLWLARLSAGRRDGGARRIG